jgi:hypothetical protein
MLLTTATEPLLVCAMSHAGPAGDCRRGERVYASDPRVAAAANWFVSPDVPESEWPTPFDQVVAEDERKHKAELEAERQRRIAACEANRVRLEAPAILKAKRDIYDFTRLRLIVKGSTVGADDPAVAEDVDGWIVLAAKGSSGRSSCGPSTR